MKDKPFMMLLFLFRRVILPPALSPVPVTLILAPTVWTLVTTAAIIVPTPAPLTTTVATHCPTIIAPLPATITSNIVELSLRFVETPIPPTILSWPGLCFKQIRLEHCKVKNNDTQCLP